MRSRGDGIRQPLEQIVDIDELREALLHIDGMATENSQDRIDESLRNHCYFRGDYMSLLRAAPKSVQNKLEKVSQLRVLQKDIIQHKIQNYTSLLARAAPKAQIKALMPDAPSEYQYDTNAFIAGDYDNRTKHTQHLSLIHI